MPRRGKFHPLTITKPDGSVHVAHKLKDVPGSKPHRRKVRHARWKKTRHQALERDGYKCVRCGGDKTLEVHHLTYERYGYERLDDLITLCQRCHATEHAWQRRLGCLGEGSYG